MSTDSAAKLLRNDRDSLAGLVGAAAQHLGIDTAFVDKDFWVTEVLRAATRPRTIVVDEQDVPVELIFKGGTSLSRAHGLIERFSDDVDLLVGFPSTASTGARDRVLNDVCAAVRSHLDLPEQECVLVTSTS